MNNCKIIVMDQCTDVKKLAYVISKLEKRIVPSLTSQGIDVLVYADKLAKNAIIIELREDEELCGIAAVYANDMEKKTAFLSFIAVDGTFEGKGYGGLLLSHVECVARERGMAQVILEVSAINVHAQSFYEKNGYEQIRESEHSIFMEKQIGNI